MKEVLSARQDALKSVEDLGVTVKLDEKVSTDPLKPKDLEMLNEDADKAELLISENESAMVNLQDEIYTQEECSKILNEINELKNAKIIEDKLHAKLHHSISFSRVKSETIPMYIQNEITKDSSSNSSQAKSKYFSLLEVIYNGKKMFIHKSTAVWIFQEGERVSSDRLIRVREKQPLSTSKTMPTAVTTTTPDKYDVISVGDICAFVHRGGDSDDSDWRIDKVLQFAYYLEKTKKVRQYTGSLEKCNEENINKIGIVCSWFCSSSNKQSYSIQTDLKATSITSFLCICTSAHYQLNVLKL